MFIKGKEFRPLCPANYQRTHHRQQHIIKLFNELKNYVGVLTGMKQVKFQPIAVQSRHD